MSNLPKLIFTVGIPGSGKSTWTETHKEELNAVIHSSDAIREELGDVNDQSQNNNVFDILHKRVKEDLLAEKNVIYDSTGIKRKNRLSFLREIQHIPCEKVCVLFATPYEICLANNSTRERHVPEEVILRMLKSFEVPAYSEGWDDIQIVWWNYKDIPGFEYDYESDLERWCKVSHDNPNHSLSIGEHMISAFNHMLEKTSDSCLLNAAIMHDCGKPFTKAFIDSKGMVCETAHYYNHHYVSCYLSLFYLKETNLQADDILYAALLIELHMNPFLKWKDSDKAKEKDRKLFGDATVKDIEILHECDKAAH